MGRSPTTSGRIAAAVLLCSLAAIGCEAPQTEDDGAPPAGRIELGELSADRTFTPYADGTEEPIILGIQGGYHIFVDGRLVGGVVSGEFLVALVVTYDDGSELTRIEHLRSPELTDDEDNPTLPEMIIFIPDPDAAADRDVLVEATVEADGGPVTSDSAQLHLVAAEGEETSPPSVPPR